MMFKIRTFIAAAAAITLTAAVAQVVGTLPYTLQNNTVADANQVMANFNAIKNDTNTNAANAGTNTNITALNGLVTPIAYTVGGTAAYIGGTSTGSANAQVVSSPVPNGFTLVAGKSITFIAGYTNAAAMTLNIASTGATNVYRQTTAGPAALVGGEIVAGNLVTAIYDGTQYQVGNQNPQSLVAPGTLADFVGVAVPSGWLSADGTAVSRTTYAALHSTIAYTGVAATTTSGNASVAVANSALYKVGWSVGGSNVTCNATISSIPDGTHISISIVAGSSGATTLTIGPYQQGDCSTTFNLPNFTGRITAGVDGTTRITSATCTNAGSLGSYCGAQNQVVAQANLPVVTLTTTIASGQGSHTHNFTTDDSVGGGSAPYAGQGGVAGTATTAAATLPAMSGTTPLGGSATALPTLPPIGTVYKIVKF